MLVGCLSIGIQFIQEGKGGKRKGSKLNETGRARTGGWNGRGIFLFELFPFDKEEL